MKPPFHRRKFLINTDFQFPFIARMVVINLLTMAVLFIGLYLIFYRFNFLGNELGLESGHRFYEFVREQFVLISALFVGAALSSSIVLAVYAIFLSHRIAGPLENLKLRFKELQENAPENCKTTFRKDDFFHDLAGAYNEHLDNVQKLHDEARKDT
ncbi:MAG: hypothetical protein KC478_06615 [Bacteriovoracaceae bacterium]|nr:hypothetical protein [Bacteriovoracaceae bacterium]